MRWTGPDRTRQRAAARWASIDEGVAMMKAAVGDLPSAASVHAIADGYRAFEHGDVDGGLADVDARHRRAAHRVRLRPARARGHRRARPHRRALAELHGGRPEAALRTVRRLDALSPEPFSDVAADTRVRARPRGRRRRREARGARRRIADLARVASGPGVMAVVEAVHAFTGRRDEPPPAGGGDAVRARAAARAGRRAVVRRRRSPAPRERGSALGALCCRARPAPGRRARRRR